MSTSEAVEVVVDLFWVEHCDDRSVPENRRFAGTGKNSSQCCFKPPSLTNFITRRQDIIINIITVVVNLKLNLNWTIQRSNLPDRNRWKAWKQFRSLQSHARDEIIYKKPFLLEQTGQKTKDIVWCVILGNKWVYHYQRDKSRCSWCKFF